MVHPWVRGGTDQKSERTDTYDLNGNRTRVVTPTQTVVAAYDAQDRLVSAGSATVTHSALGAWTRRVAGADTTRYRYDAGGALRDVWLPTGTHVQYAVDAEGRRTARLVNGVVTQRWLYQSALAIAAEVDSAGQPRYRQQLALLNRGVAPVDARDVRS